MRHALAVLSLACSLCLGAVVRGAQSPDPAVLAAQDQRAAAVARASEATVAVFDASGGGGGSGVLISDDGYALTNFHVTAPCGPAMKCGLPDGKLYDAVIVGVDPVGDVALIQLLGRDDFPAAEIGDSDAVRVGDWAFAAGNPFLLADDFTPSISYGLISGVHRYQYPAGTLLEYTDCLQTDAAINPGNSGGPLFNAAGRLIGINGRGSFEKRGRVNVGVGYAISVNQIMRFLPHLKSGRIVDHATLGATVTTEENGAVVINDILDTSDAFRRGLQYGDQIVRFADREITSANALKNVLGVFPRGWRTPLTFRREGRTFSTAVRLMGVHDDAELIELVQSEIENPSEPDSKDQQPGDSPEKPRKDESLPRRLPGGRAAKTPKVVSERYTARRGYANYWYNEQQQERLWRRFLERTASRDVGYDWTVIGDTENGGSFKLSTTSEAAEVQLPSGSFKASFTDDLSGQLSPPRTGGLLVAIHAWQRLLDKGLRRFGEVYYLGQLPHGVDNRVEDCLVGLFEGMEIRFFFAADTGDLTGIELFAADDLDPCEISFSEFGEFAGRRMPKRWLIRSGDETFAELVAQQWQMNHSSSETRGGEK